MKKVAIIGAGSLVFARKLTCDILQYEDLRDTHFALVDTDEERLRFASRIMERIIAERAPDATYSASTNRRDVLADCDFVIISILVGGYEAIESEIDIPKKYGVSQAVGDTLTPGGVMRCLRTLPELVAMAKDIEELCPTAHVLNYTNPMGMLSRGIMEASPELTYVGLCHSVQGTLGEWANRLDIPEDEIAYTAAGINHTAWFIRMERDGEDLLPRVRECAYDPAVWLGDTARSEYVKHFGYPVTESSGHNSEYVPWFRKDDETVEKYCPGGNWNGEHGWIKKLYSRNDWREQMERMASGEDELPADQSREYGSRIIHAIATGESELIYGNVLNGGCILNLPADACVEVPCYIDRTGINPIKVGALPEHLAAVNRMELNVQSLAVKAAQTADPEVVFQAMALDPLTSMACTLDEIRAMTRELLEAHRPWLPAFEGKRLEEKKVMVGCTANDVEEHIDPSQEQ